MTMIIGMDNENNAIIYSSEEYPKQYGFEYIVVDVPDPPGDDVILKTDLKRIWWKKVTIKTESIRPDPISKLQKENVLLKAKIEANTTRQEFLEDCIAEMAQIVYQ